jgi:hypothetical protein
MAQRSRQGQRSELQDVSSHFLRFSALRFSAIFRSVTTVAPHEPWYKYGVAFLLFEIAVAIAVSGYSLYMTFNGLGGFPGKH